MKTIFVTGTKNGTLCVTYKDDISVSCLRNDLIEREGFTAGDYYILHRGKRAQDDDLLGDGAFYHLQPRLCGGKGGFGSMLRAIGAQIEKTTSREACRDLSGRRMRDVNNEKKLREWVAKQADREREKEQRRQERLERRRAEPRHNFDDPQYHKQKQQVFEGLEDALQTGLQKAAVAGTSGTSGSRKRKIETETKSKPKMAREWLGVEGLSDLSSDSDGEEESSSTPTSQDSSSASPNPPTLSEDNSTDGAENITVNEIKSRLGQVDSKEELVREDQELSHSSTDSVPETNISQTMEDGEKETKTCSVTDPPCKKENGLLTALSAIPPRQESCVPKSKSSTSVDSTPVNMDIKQQTHEKMEEEFDLSKYNSAEELLLLGGEQLKAELMALGLKCGGAPAERAQRLFSVKGLSKDKIDPKLFAKPSKGKKKKVPTATLR